MDLTTDDLFTLRVAVKVALACYAQNAAASKVNGSEEMVSYWEREANELRETQAKLREMKGADQ